MTTERKQVNLLEVTPNYNGKGEVLYGEVKDENRCLILLLIALSCIHATPEYAVARAWQDDQLRLGYLPTLPTDIIQVHEVLNKWLKEEGQATYFIYPSNYIESDPIGYIRVKEMLDNKLWITYGNVSSMEERSKGYIYSALQILIQYLTEMYQGWEIVTNVSDKNTASVKILQKCGFAFLLTDDESPIAMGGKKISAQLKL